MRIIYKTIITLYINASYEEKHRSKPLMQTSTVQNLGRKKAQLAAPGRKKARPTALRRKRLALFIAFL